MWGYEYEGGTNIVDVYIKYLRNKIEGEAERKLLHTARGIGYVMKIEGESEDDGKNKKNRK